MKLSAWAAIPLVLPLGALLGMGGQQSVSMGSLPIGMGGSGRLTVSDNFAGNALSTNWTVNVGSLSVSEGAYRGTLETGSGWDMAYWNANAFPANQYSQVTIADASGGGWLAATVRAQPSAGQAYVCLTLPSSGFTQLYVFTADGSATQIGSNAPALGNGDVLYISAVGSTITCKRNGATLISGSDSTWPAGQPGIAAGYHAPTPSAGSWSAGAL